MVQLIILHHQGQKRGSPEKRTFISGRYFRGGEGGGGNFRSFTVMKTEIQEIDPHTGLFRYLKTDQQKK